MPTDGTSEPLSRCAWERSFRFLQELPEEASRQSGGLENVPSCCVAGVDSSCLLAAVFLVGERCDSVLRSSEEAICRGRCLKVQIAKLCLDSL